MNKSNNEQNHHSKINNGHCGHHKSSENGTKERLKQAMIAGAFGALLFINHLFFQFIPSLTAPWGRSIWFIVGILTGSVMLYTAQHIYRSAWHAIKKCAANMNTLISLGTSAAWLYSIAVILFLNTLPQLAQHLYFESALMIIAFINLGSYLEARSRAHTSDAVKQLIGLQAKTARVIRNNEEIDIPISKVQVNDAVRVHPGEKIPIDGIIIVGQSTIDESMLTGEPTAHSKAKGDRVYAGCINLDGSFLMEAKQVGQETVLANIITLVRQAQNSKPPMGRLADKISSYFVPIVIFIAIVAASMWYFLGPEPQSVYMLITAMSVLIIACPCALGLATPMAIVMGIGKAAEYGILFRNADALENTSKLDTIVFDKTGTLTTGQCEVVHVGTTATVEDNIALQMAASVEQHSEHPLAKAICRLAHLKNLRLLATDSFEALNGLGVHATIKGESILLGNQLLMQQHGIDVTPFDHDIKIYLKAGNTVIYLAYEKQLMGFIASGDTLKESAAKSCKQLRLMNKKLVLLSGDNKKTVKHFAAQLGIDDYFGEVLPQQKSEIIKKLQQKNKVAMVGDGINDAPALAQADVGFAMGRGTDIAIESADINLVQNDLQHIALSIQLSKAITRNIKQNLVAAFLYNSLGIPIAAGILYPFTHWLLHPVIAAIAMALSSLTVVTNANRLRWFKESSS